MKICIVKLSAMGDIIHAMVALQFIKKYYPSCSIDWVVESGFSKILRDNPHIDRILEVDLKRLKKQKSLIFKEIAKIRSFGKNNYDIIIDAQGLLKSAIVARLIGAKSVAGFSKTSAREGIASLFYDKKITIAYEQNTIDRNVAVICGAVGLSVQRDEILQMESFLFYKPTLKDLPEKYNLFVIGSTWESRNYPKESFLEVANLLKTTTIVVWASEEERQKALWLSGNSKYIKVLPRLDLNALKELIARCDLLIGNDTGPTHMAWALGVASITLFGPTPINRIYQTPINRAIKSSSKVDHRRLDKNDFSIAEITPQEVVDLAREIV